MPVYKFPSKFKLTLAVLLMALPAALATYAHEVLQRLMPSYLSLLIIWLAYSALLWLVLRRTGRASICVQGTSESDKPEADLEALDPKPDDGGADKALLGYNIFEVSNEAVLVTDAKARILDINPAFTEITGYSRQEILGKNPSFMKSGRHDAEFFAEMWQSIKDTGKWRGEIWDRRKDGEIYAKWLSINSINNTQGDVQMYLGIFSDITSMKQTEEYHEFLAHYDSLTRLPNRLLFNDRLDQAMIGARRGGKSMALMFLDLDRFKNINDTLGHNVGDRLLQAVAERLAVAGRKNDTVARLGGDEFAIVLADIRTPADAASVAEKINLSMLDPVKVGRHDILTSTSIGITLYPQDAETREALLRNADIAMYHAKSEGRNRYQFFTSEMQAMVEERTRVESNLRDALDKGEMILYYQPQVDLKSGEVVGIEALIRRQEEEWIVQPGVFMGVAEETGLIVDICNWTLEESCRQATLWLQEGMRPVRVAVNVSAMQFELPGFVQNVRDVIASSGLSPELVELELTERILLKSSRDALEKMQLLKELGVMLAIDDFGTGYSSLSYLKTFPVDKLKIDYSFVRDIGASRESEAIVRSIISLSHNLGMVVIAEGVEKKEQLDFLRHEGCDEIQGFYFSFPLPPDNFRRLMQEGGRLAQSDRI